MARVGRENYTVVECGTNPVVDGDFYVLQDGKGVRKRIMADDASREHARCTCTRVHYCSSSLFQTHIIPVY
jgi:hypothetical protein